MEQDLSTEGIHGFYCEYNGLGVEEAKVVGRAHCSLHLVDQYRNIGYSIFWYLMH